jgi:hypothetical protein
VITAVPADQLQVIVIEEEHGVRVWNANVVNETPRGALTTTTVPLSLNPRHGTIIPPDPQAAARLITAYIKAGGPPQTAAPRGGLPACNWALGWHRVWISGWYAEQIERCWAGSEVTAWTGTISRHLDEAAVLLGPVSIPRRQAGLVSRYVSVHLRRIQPQPARTAPLGRRTRPAPQRPPRLALTPPSSPHCGHPRRRLPGR